MTSQSSGLSLGIFPGHSFILSAEKAALALGLQAFDGYVKGLLRRRYPPELMTELQTAFGSALADLADAFPEKTYAQTSNMQTFLKVSQ